MEEAYDWPVAYDEVLAERIRDHARGTRALTEKKMFGGLAFLVGGNMAVAAMGGGGLLVRVAPEESDALVAGGEAELMVMRGRAMRGWVRVDPERVQDERTLAQWVERGTAYAASLPAKD
jgi:TfoX/Sxy family transcriptional regulator of competence genes